jgi:tRNA-(ms[2]io[6]A)-hydroxylase
LTVPDPVISFLGCRTASLWVDRAIAGLDELLLDHATLELKAAQQAQKMIWQYGFGQGGRHQRGATQSDRPPIDPFRSTLVHRMSRLAREELRHFEQVVGLLDQRGLIYRVLSPSRYAAGLHELVRKEEPGRLVDQLLVGAIIEARSCERFGSLIPALNHCEPELARFYRSLLRSEARHFEDYLALASQAGGGELAHRLNELLARDRSLIESPDDQSRFLSGAPIAG